MDTPLGVVQTDLERSDEFQRSMAMRRACDRVLCDLLKPDWIQREEGTTLDKQLGIDATVRLKHGGCITVQEKCLSFEYWHVLSCGPAFTLEVSNNRHEGTQDGELYHLAAQLYLHGYSDHSGTQFAEWWVLNVPMLQIWLDRYWDGFKRLAVKNSRADFLLVPYGLLQEAKGIVLAHKKCMDLT